jgi:urease accessory protein UreE
MLRIETHAKRQISDTETLSLPRLVLPFDLRQKSRLRATLDNGVEAALFLPRGTVLRHGDLLEAEDRTLIRVVAAPEDVLYATADKPHDLLRAAYHLGNRHVPVELGEGYLKLATDPVLKEMLSQLGLTAAACRSASTASCRRRGFRSRCSWRRSWCCCTEPRTEPGRRSGCRPCSSGRRRGGREGRRRRPRSGRTPR